jgi:hypothetical protein
VTQLNVERIGGFGGFGLPGGGIRSRGSIDTERLSPADSRALDALFAAPPSASTPDAFRYRLTRGAQTIEVSEAHVPEAVRAVVRDELV